MASSERDGRVAAFPLVQPQDGASHGMIAIIRRLSTARTLGEVTETVTRAARTLLGADGITFVLRDGALCRYVDEDAIGPLWKGKSFPMSACISGWCMEHAQAVAIPDIRLDDRIPQEAYRPTFVRSLAMAPVRQDEPIAALGAYWSEPHEATAAELELLQSIANAAALALALVQLRESRGEAEAKALARSREGRAWDYHRLIPKRPTALWRRLAIGFGLAAAAWLARSALTPFVGGNIPYATSFVAVVLAAVWGGRGAGLCALVASGLIANWSFVGAPGEFSLAGAHLWTLLAFWGMAGILVLLAEAMVEAMQREALLNSRLQLVGNELQHRIRNFISVAQALAQQTVRSSDDVAEFEKKFAQRLHALGAAQALLAGGRDSQIRLTDLVEQVLKPFGAQGRVEVRGGPDLALDEQTATGIALLLNELATNAIKYGALSGDEGGVTLQWQVADGRARLLWKEQGGPPVAASRKSGFGTRMMKSALPRSRGAARIEYAPDGVRCEIEFAAPAC